MEFKNVRLPASVIADLYKQSLVIIDDQQPITTAWAAAIETAAKPTAVAEPPAVFPSAPPIAKPAVIPEPQSTDETPFKYLGGFQKQVSIVVSEHFNPHISQEDLDFLSKLLMACKLSLNDVAIINIASNPQATQLWKRMPAKAMLLFDVDPGEIGLSFRRPHFEVQEWAESKFMCGPSLESFRLGDDASLKILKGKLWVSLQKIFLGK